MCTPSKSKEHFQPCGFSDFPKKIISADEILNLNIFEKPFTDVNWDEINEFLDYLKFPVMTLPQGTVLCHSVSMETFYNESKNEINVDQVYWWKHYFPGQASYKGGWFTYETSYGGPDFGMSLYYRLEEDLTLLFIPNDFAEKYNQSDPQYYSESERLFKKSRFISRIDSALRFPDKLESQQNIDTYINMKGMNLLEIELQEKLKDIKENPHDLILLEEARNKYLQVRSFYRNEIKTKYPGRFIFEMVNHSELYSGSHLIEGVEDWEKKGYRPIEHTGRDYADNLAIKLANLGFNGYISCDECEVYITHEAMKRVLTQPFDVDFSNKYDKFPLIKNIIRKAFELPHIPLTVTKVLERDFTFNHIQTPEDFIQHFKNVYSDKFT